MIFPGAVVTHRRRQQSFFGLADNAKVTDPPRRETISQRATGDDAPSNKNGASPTSSCSQERPHRAGSGAGELCDELPN